MGFFTFDWGQIAFNGPPFYVPWWAAANVGITVAFFYWVVAPILYVKQLFFSSFRVSCLSEYRVFQYTNVWSSAYLPLMSSDTFDNTGKHYDVSQVINSDFSFNLQGYKNYSPIFLPVSMALSYGLSFATVAATLTHTFLYYRKYIWAHARRSNSEKPDIHARLMSVYKEVPDWWYWAIFGLRHL